jgi:hypothetical protein
MSLIGRLEEMPLQDILQILAMSRRTGHLNLTRGPARAGIAFRDGQIIGAVTERCGQTVGQRLLAAGQVNEDVLQQALDLQRTTCRGRLVGSILVELGATTLEAVEDAISDQIAEMILELLQWDAGCFKFVPIVDATRLVEEFPISDSLLTRGLNAEQLLIDLLRKMDESDARGEAYRPLEYSRHPSQEVAVAQPEPELDDPVERALAGAAMHRLLDSSVDAMDGKVEVSSEDLEQLRRLFHLDIDPEGPPRTTGVPSMEVALVKSLMYELQAPRFTGEVTLMIMRFAADRFRRGLLLAVHPDGLGVIARFGVGPGDQPLSREARQLRIQLDRRSVFTEVIRTRQIVRYSFPLTTPDPVLSEMLGGTSAREFLAAPLIVAGEVAGILYVDNVPAREPIGSTECLEMLMIHAGMCIEKTRMEIATGAPRAPEITTS